MVILQVVGRDERRGHTADGRSHVQEMHFDRESARRQMEHVQRRSACGLGAVDWHKDA
jgi:hypothetical protein